MREALASRQREGDGEAAAGGGGVERRQRVLPARLPRPPPACPPPAVRTHCSADYTEIKASCDPARALEDRCTACTGALVESLVETLTKAGYQASTASWQGNPLQLFHPAYTPVSVGWIQPSIPL